MVAFLGAIIAFQPGGDLGKWLYLAGMAGFSAGLEAIAKALREFVAAGDYDHFLHKLPI